MRFNMFNLGVIRKPLMFLGGWCFRVSPRMLTCREFNAFIFDYTEGDLNDKQSKLFKRHMKFCPICRIYLKTYIAGYKAGKASPLNSDLDVPDEVPQNLLNAIVATSDDAQT